MPNEFIIRNGLIVESGTTTITGSVTATGDVVARTNLKSMYQAGDEGGEIFLSTPATNTTIPNGVTIDVYQNRLRIFEQGGSTNGYYLEMPSGSASVGTNLSPIGLCKCWNRFKTCWIYRSCSYCWKSSWISNLNF